MIKKILIANRGEIACRVIKTAKRLGISTVAIYSDIDAHALHVSLADEAVYVGGAAAKDSYLKGKTIIEKAKSLSVDAIHPGYGFLSENADFAESCEASGIIFIGPPSEAIKAMGSKSAAKSIMESAQVPLVPGYHGDDQSNETLKKAAIEMGFPVLLKAAAGGGGKGMRQVHHLDQFDQALLAAKRESMNAFGDDVMLVEKYLLQPRHVEIQVFCDQHGNGVYLFERDCSVQRRHQKIIEEAPAPNLSIDTRKQMGEAAVKAAQAINYVGAGTVEFLLDVDGSFYFMEMNTRLQVEHPVTEMITGEDLVEWQIYVADGQTLPKKQDELQLKGHAFEARIYAEDPDNDFLPATGTLTLLNPPQESTFVRVDTGVIEGDEISIFYDPMIAKLIVWDKDRTLALHRLQKALANYHIDGVTTNIQFLYNLATSTPFEQADLCTTFIEKHQDKICLPIAKYDENAIAIMSLTVLLKSLESAHCHPKDPYSPWAISNNWRANEQHSFTINLSVIDKVIQVLVTPVSINNRLHWDLVYEHYKWRVFGSIQGQTITANINGHVSRATYSTQGTNYKLFTSNYALTFSQLFPSTGEDTETHEDKNCTAPMNGTVVTQLVEPNIQVKKGDGLMVIEAMKMEHTISAPSDGEVIEFYFHAGDLVEGGATLLAFKENDA